MNKIFVTGARLVADPTTNTIAGSRNATKVRIACNNTHKGEDGQYGTNWYNATIWGTRGDTFAKFFHKGDPVNIFGELVIRDYTDKNGQLRQSNDIENADWEFCPKNSRNDSAAPAAAAPAPAAAPQNFTRVEDPDDLPF